MWKIGDRVFFKKEEFTHSFETCEQDAWIGDTGVIEYIDERYSDDPDIGLWYVVKLDDNTMNDGRNRSARMATGDHETIENLSYVERLFNADLKLLSEKLKIEIKELSTCLMEGRIFVFNTIDDLAKFYYEAEIYDCMDMIKKEIKDGLIVYSQHKFWMLS